MISTEIMEQSTDNGTLAHSEFISFVAYSKRGNGFHKVNNASIELFAVVGSIFEYEHFMFVFVVVKTIDKTFV